jgi:hypothetical protein
MSVVCYYVATGHMATEDRHMPPLTFTTGDLCKRFGVMPWHIIQLLRRGFLEEPPRVGPFRYWTEADLSRVEDALRRAGYLPREEAVRV